MQNTNLSVTKSMLAKLLAGENITVVHERIKTAYFDLKNRVLHLPIFENMDGPLYDLLVGHEDGHALYTPEEGWHGAIVDENMLTDKQKARGAKFNSGFKSVLNVVEDARIEKLIKRKYPGIAKSFVIGYKDLYERDFFGVKRLKSLSQLNIIDRVNLHAKCGSFLVVPFNDDERAILREIEHAETWEQVVDISTRLYNRAIEERDEYINSMEDLTEQLMQQFEQDSMSEKDMEDMFNDDQEDQEEGSDGSFKPFDPDHEDKEDTAPTSGDGDEDGDKELVDDDGSKPEEGEESGDATDGSGDSTESGEETDEDGKESTGGEESDEDSDEDTDDSASEGSGAGTNDGNEEKAEEQDEPVESVTDRIFREREQELIVGDTEVFTYHLPKPLLDNIIIPNKLMVEIFHEGVQSAIRRSGRDVPLVATCVKKFNDANMRYINLLAKEFEMRKNAAQYARTTQARTGELDMSKLHQYKFSSNLFKKMNIVPKGKNHGMMMFVDMSGSMNSCFGPTIEQTLILVAFCRKVGIPFDVYGFSDYRYFTEDLVAKGRLPRTFNQQKFQKLAGDNYEVSDDHDLNLPHLIGSSLPPAQYKRAYEMMAVVAMNYRNVMYPNVYIPWENNGWKLNGTPFAQTVMASRPMIERFKNATKCDIVNVIYLTDGEGGGCFTFKDIPWVYTYSSKPKTKKIVYMIDPVTKERLEFDPHASHQQQAKITEYVRKITGCKHIGFYIGSRGDLRSTMRLANGADELEYKARQKNLREHGYFAIPNLGYDNYYYVQSASKNVDDDDFEFTEEMTKRKMASVFIDAQEGKRKNRVLISTFVKDIATV